MLASSPSAGTNRLGGGGRDASEGLGRESRGVARLQANFEQSFAPMYVPQV